MNERIASPSYKSNGITYPDQYLDPRRSFVEQFLRYKFHIKEKLPTSWQEAVDWLLEFDAKRNEASIAFENMFHEHMRTCTRPTIVRPEVIETLSQIRK